MAAASALVRALRGRRGPVAAAMALGRRGLGGAYPSRGPLVMRRSLASGNGTEGSGAAGHGAGTGVGSSGCTGMCAKQVLDLRAQMSQAGLELQLSCGNQIRENIVLRAMVVACQTMSDESLTRQSNVMRAFGVGGSLVILALFVIDLWPAKRKEITNADEVADHAKKELAHKEDAGAEPPKE